MAFTFGEWHNNSTNRAESYLKDANGQTAYFATGTSAILVNGQRYTVAASTFAPNRSETVNRLFGLTFDSRLSNDWRLESAFSLYQTPTDSLRTAASPTLSNGTVALSDGTGWNNADLRLIWEAGWRQGRPYRDGWSASRCLYVRLQKNTMPVNWLSEDSKTALTDRNYGRTQTQAIYLQDEWKFAPRFTLTAGVRQEQWQASKGEIYTSALGQKQFPANVKRAVLRPSFRWLGRQRLTGCCVARLARLSVSRR